MGNVTMRWGCAVILISRDWIRRFVRCIREDGKIVPDVAKKLTVPSLADLSQPNGATYENGKIGFRKRDNRPLHFGGNTQVSLYPFWS